MHPAAAFFRVARPALRAYWRFTRPLTLGVRGVVLNDSGDVLLVRHTYVPGWHFPGGGVSRAETVEQALARELREEVGVTLHAPPTFRGLYANFHEWKSDHVALFEIREFDLTPRRNLEIAEQAFFPLSALPDETTAATRRRLDELAGGVEPAMHW